jgi:hypothetical protein
MSIPFHAAQTVIGTCQYTEHLGDCECPLLLLPCPVEEVVEISVNQNDEGKQVLGTMCREHAAIWSANHIAIKE